MRGTWHDISGSVETELNWARLPCRGVEQNVGLKKLNQTLEQPAMPTYFQ